MQNYRYILMMQSGLEDFFIRRQRLMYSTRVCSLVNLRGGWVGRGGHPPPCLPPHPPAPHTPHPPPTPHPQPYLPPTPTPHLPPPTPIPPPPCLPPHPPPAYPPTPPHLPPPPTHNLHHHQLTHLNKEKTKTKRN